MEGFVGSCLRRHVCLYHNSLWQTHSYYHYHYHYYYCCQKSYVCMLPKSMCSFSSGSALLSSPDSSSSSSSSSSSAGFAPASSSSSSGGDHSAGTPHPSSSSSSASQSASSTTPKAQNWRMIFSNRQKEGSKCEVPPPSDKKETTKLLPQLNPKSGQIDRSQGRLRASLQRLRSFVFGFGLSTGICFFILYYQIQDDIQTLHILVKDTAQRQAVLEQKINLLQTEAFARQQTDRSVS